MRLAKLKCILESFGLQGPEAYLYTSRSNCLTVDGIDDVKDWSETLVFAFLYKVLPSELKSCAQQAMAVIGLDVNEQSEIFRMIATILWLGNVQFSEQDDGNSAIADSGVTDFIAYLLELDSALLEKVLTSRVVETQRGGRRGMSSHNESNISSSVLSHQALYTTCL